MFCLSHIYLILISTIAVHGVLSAAALGVMYDNTWSEKHMLYIDITATFTVRVDEGKLFATLPKTRQRGWQMVLILT